MLRLCGLVVVCCCTSGALTAATGAVTPVGRADPGALQIFDAALAKFQTDRAALRQWQYHQTLTTEQFDSSGKVTAKGNWKSIVRPGDPRPFEYTSKSMQGQLSFFKTEPEEPAAPAEGGKGAPQPDAKEINQAEWAVEAVRKYKLRDRYSWKRLPDERAAGENCYVLSFTPKPSQNTSSREERFFALLAGKLWVSELDDTVVKAQAGLQAPCHLFWLIARVTTFDMTYELEPAGAAGRLFRPSKATAKTVVKFPFYAVRQRHWLTADHYERRSPRGSRRDAMDATTPSPASG